MYHADLWLATSGDDERDFDNLEVAAAGWVAAGFQPHDSEPGAWVHLRHADGRLVQIQVDPTTGQEN